MTVENPQTQSGTDHRADQEIDAGVIDDARARQRRHRQIGAAVVAAIVAGIALIIGAGGGGDAAGIASRRGGSTAKPAISSRRLPERVGGSGLPRVYTEMQVLGDKLVVSGSNNSQREGDTPLTSSWDAAPGAAASQDCYAAIVNPQSLTLSDQHSGNCDDPALYGMRAIVLKEITHQNDHGCSVMDIRTSHVTANRAGFALSPVLASFTRCSEDSPAFIYGDGYMWVWFPITRWTPRGGTNAASEVLRISETTGALLQTTRMPGDVEPALATNQYGLWIAPSPESDPYAGIYRVAPGMTHASRVHMPLRRLLAVNWMLGSGRTLWLDVRGLRDSAGRLMRLSGPDGKTTLQVHAPGLTNDVVGVGPYAGNPTIGGGARIGLWTLTSVSSSITNRRQLLTVTNPTTGHEQTVAAVTVPGPLGGSVVASAALDTSVFFLANGRGWVPTSPGSAVVNQGVVDSVLYRVSPR